MNCQACAFVLRSDDQASYINQLLLDEGRCPLCRACRTQRGPGQGPPLATELATPEVPYDTWHQFSELVYAAQDSYCLCVRAAMQHALERRQLSLVLGRVWGFPPRLSYLQEHGPACILPLTKHHGAFWCKMVAHFVYTRATRAAAIYNDVLATLADGDDERFASTQSSAQVLEHLIHVMQQEVRHTFSGAMPFNIYSLSSGFVSALLVKNFTFYDDRDMTAFTAAQYRAILLALGMGQHPRLGSHSPLLALDTDTLQTVCAGLCASQLMKHIVFHTQEQWLVA